MSAHPVKPSARTTLLAAAGGLVLLVAMFGFAVGLPELADDEGSSSSAELDLLPDTLPGELVSLLSPDLPPEVVEQSGGAEQLTSVVDSASANVAELFGEPAAFGIYGRVDGSALLTITVGPGEPGLFVPDGAPVSAEVQGAARSNLEVTRVGDAVCSTLFSQPIQAGQPVDPEELPGRVHCQLPSSEGASDEASGLLYDVTGQGLSVEATVEAAEAVRALQEDPDA